MKKLFTALTLIALPFLMFAQEENMMLMPFKPMMEGVWKGEGTWKDGRAFKQEVTFEWGIGKQNVKTFTKSLTDTLGNFGEFSEMIHAWGNTDNKIRFWAFDIKGNIVEGDVQTKSKQIRYIYDYTMPDGTKQTLTDAWIWIKDDKYMMKVGVTEGDEWTEVLGEFYFWRKEN